MTVAKFDMRLYRNDLESDSIEIIWLELQFSNKSIVLGLLYRPPNADRNSNVNCRLTQMERMLLAAYLENKTNSAYWGS